VNVIDQRGNELLVEESSEAAVDAAHIAIASVHEMDFLLTWNCRHIANPSSAVLG